MLQTIWTRIKLIARELLNIITNVLTPMAAIVCLAMEIMGLPAGAIAIAKKVEYWLFKAGATQDIIENVIVKVDAYLTIYEAKQQIEDLLSDVDSDEIKDTITGVLDSVEDAVDLEDVKDLVTESLQDIDQEEVKDTILGILGNIGF